MQDQARPKPWPLRWAKSEEFWQGIATQTIGSLFAALIILIVAVFAGVGYTPAIRFYVVYSICLLVILVLTVALITALLVVSDTMEFMQHSRIATLIADAIYGILAILAVTIAIVIRSIIASWTGYQS
jgi:hypothetical protein